MVSGPAFVFGNKQNLMAALKILPCLDSQEMAERRRAELNIPTNVAADLGRSAVEAAVQGRYRNPQGEEVDWSREIQAACEAKVSIPPGAGLPTGHNSSFPETRVQVTNETTLGAGADDNASHPLAQVGQVIAHSQCSHDLRCHRDIESCLARQ